MAKVIRETKGVAAVFTRSDILAGRLPESDIARRVRAGFHPTRFPDVYVVNETYWLEGTTPASHGSPYRYDTLVPVIFYGAGVPAAEILSLGEDRDPRPEVVHGVKAKPERVPRRQGF